MANIFEVPQPGNDLLKKADQVRLAAIKISQTENHNRIEALNFMADYLEKYNKEILEANNEDYTKAEEKGISKALLSRLKLSKEKLLELAIDIEGHPDNVVPSLLGGLCLTARSSSQRWRIIRCDWHDSIKAVIAIPAIRLSTSEARKVMPKNVPISDAVTNMGALTLLLNGLKAGNAELIKEGMFDKLHEPYRWKLIKGGLEVKDAALNAGALGCAISGAGPSILALCKKENGKNVSQAMVKAWEKSGVASRAPFLNVQTTGSQFSTISGK